MTEGIEESDLLRLDEVRTVWRLTGSSTRQWVVAEARIRLLRSRGRHAAQWSAGFSARPGPISQVAETNPKGTRGSRGAGGVIIITTKRAALLNP